MTHGRGPGMPEEAKADPPQGSFEVGINKWMARRLMQLHPEIEPNVRSTVRGIVGSGFTDKELRVLEDRAIEAAEWDDVPALKGIEPGVPVELAPAQGRIIDRIVDGMGDDELGQRARGSYRRARKNGQIQVR